MNDILPPKRPINATRPAQRPQPARISPRPSAPTATPPQKQPQPATPLLEQPVRPLLIETPKKSRKKLIIGILVGILVLLAVIAGAAFMWYKNALLPVSSQPTEKMSVEIENGSSPGQIGTLLEERKLIRSSFAFDIYTRLSGTRMQLQAGTYRLAASESTEDIVGHIVAGKVDQFSLTFLPGATLAENRAGLIKAGYDPSEVDTALEKIYDHPLFADKPEGTDLEGYIYGETYRFPADATAEQVLKRTFDEFYAKITENKLIEGFKAHGLNLYQGITLASIIQREVPHASDQKQVAQVFLGRLKSGMELGSDVTYQYAAKKLNVDPTPSLESPYNTRKYSGLPPGPIATPGLTALQAVASPANGDYVFFLSGDDDVTYFARTSEEHEANIKNHCAVKCSVF